MPSNASSLYAFAPINTETDKLNRTPHDCASYTFLPLVAHISTYSTALPRGIISSPILPAFTVCWRQAMATSSHYPYPIPNSPRISSTSPISSDDGMISKDSYLRPVTRSITRTRNGSHEKHLQRRNERVFITHNNHINIHSRSPLQQDGGFEKSTATNTEPPATFKVARRKTKDGRSDKRNNIDGHLRPENKPRSSWRDISRSQSPLGLIPIHRNWRSFVSFLKVLLNALWYLLTF